MTNPRAGGRYLPTSVSTTRVEGRHVISRVCLGASLLTSRERLEDFAQRYVQGLMALLLSPPASYKEDVNEVD